MTQRSTSDGATCSVAATRAYGRSCPMFWKPRSARVSRRILHSSCSGFRPNVEETSGCARCQARRSSRPPLRNIRRSAKSGCDLAERTASSLKSGSKSSTAGSESAVAIASSAAGCVDFDAGSRERTCASL
jgi:hypothetical protein